METCVKCEIEFGRITDDHTTEGHLRIDLANTIESYEREDYHHGKSAFRNELEADIKSLEKQIKEIVQ